MNPKLTWCAGLAALVACVEPPEPPPNTIPKAQMVQILTDIHLAEAKVGRLTVGSVDSTRALYARYEREVFLKHRVDTATYYRSYRFYIENTDQLDEIYRAVVDSLSLRERTGRLD